MVAHSLGTIATYLAIRHGWLGTGRLVLLAPMVEAASLVDQFQGALGFGPPDPPRLRARTPTPWSGCRSRSSTPASRPRTRTRCRRSSCTTAATGRRRTATRVTLVDGLPTPMVTTEGLGHRRILRDPAVLRTVVAFIRDDRESAVA